MSYLKFSAAALAMGLAAATAMPAQAAPNKDKCVAEFARYDSNRDDRLDSTEGRRYSEVASQVDVNKDGMISSDEYIVACTKDVFKKIDSLG